MGAKLLALDPSLTATGYCLAEDRPAPMTAWKHGTVRAQMLSQLAMWFAMMLADAKPDMVLYEEPIQAIMLYGKKQLIHLPGGGQMVTPNAAQTVLWKIEGMLIGLATAAACPIVTVPVRTWRAAVLGDGNLDRDTAKQRAKVTCQRLGIDIRSVDEAEACCIGLYGLGTIEWRDAVRRDVHDRLGGAGREQ